MRSGVVVAGGFSTRFGEGDKTVAELAGTPLIRRVADRIADTVDDVVVNCRADQRSVIENAMAGFEPTIRYAVDERPDRGPAAGIRNGLAAASGEYAVVVACDMPFVDPELVTYLFDRAAGTDGAVPRLDGHRQPLQAVYRCEPMKRACSDALGRGESKILAVLSDLACAVVEQADVKRVTTARSFTNINTRAGLRAAERWLHSH